MQTSYQFIHVNTYSRSFKSNKKGKEKGWSAREIADEGSRKPGSYSEEIVNPQPPIVHVGVDPQTAVDHAYAWANDQVEVHINKKTGKEVKRKLREDTPILMAGVFSVPKGTPPEQWKKTMADSIQFLKDEYGDRLVSVFEHIDEDHPHCHFFVVPRHNERMYDIHDGLKAQRELSRNKLPHANEAYKAAMVAFQDRYFAKVGNENGFLRKGPKRERLSRQEWKDRKAEHILTLERRTQLNLTLETAEANLTQTEQAAAAAAIRKNEIEASVKAEKAKLVELAPQVVALRETLKPKVQAELNGNKETIRGFMHHVKNLFKLQWPTAEVKAQYRKKRAAELMREKVTREGQRALEEYRDDLKHKGYVIDGLRDELEKYSDVIPRATANESKNIALHTQALEHEKALKALEKSIKASSMSEIQELTKGKTSLEEQLMKANSDIKDLKATLDIEREELSTLKRAKVLRIE